MPTDILRPGDDEFAPYYAGYIDQAARTMAARGLSHVAQLLEAQRTECETLLRTVPEERAAYRYAPGKWTLAESLIHVTDTERVFAYRLLRIARGDVTPLPGFEQDDWVPASRAGQRTLASITRELLAVRTATLELVDSLDAEALAQRGVASGKAVSARALVWMMAGHLAHHLTLTREQYLAS
jgi:hypothetical protein